MKSILSSYSLASVALITVFSGAIYLNYISGSNEIDSEGLRQGYWTIYGSMSSEEGFSDSGIVEEGSYENDMKVGVWKKYYPSGKLRSEITYVNNRPVGDYTLYYENGVVEESGNWQKTKNIGSFSRNFENGNPHQRFEFADSGKRNGLQYYYHSNGQLALQVDIMNGKETGVMKRYNESGELTEEKSFNNGSYISGSTKDLRSKKEKEEEYVPEPVETEKDSGVKGDTSAPEEEEETNSAIHFQPNGHNILYDSNKNISQTGLFKDGRLWNGKYYKYNKNGILIRVDIYRNGRFIGHGLMEDE